MRLEHDRHAEHDLFQRRWQLPVKRIPTCKTGACSNRYQIPDRVRSQNLIRS
ncbi:hypothetical protein EV13_2324 [Prochlorococcus sp. MIT 0702]|nr:hypothetical protein EV12_1956 [Prochlorococcus sp. MIT 0701]KGG26863.1 hypothetical protein EV13_2324 [Prochlorococcus sp. MIT 0702]KGG36139.1 hypothetical protein EV14_0548 [Prochlorococcus sp. MIT 0703]